MEGSCAPSPAVLVVSGVSQPTRVRWTTPSGRRLRTHDSPELEGAVTRRARGRGGLATPAVWRGPRCSHRLSALIRFDAGPAPRRRRLSLRRASFPPLIHLPLPREANSITVSVLACVLSNRARIRARLRSASPVNTPDEDSTVGNSFEVNRPTGCCLGGSNTSLRSSLELKQGLML